MQGASTTESYTYDQVGNRLSSLGMSSYTYNSSNELTSKPGTTYTYDHNGNLLTKSDASGTTSYSWDYYTNRLNQVRLPAGAGTVTFRYDPFGRRIQKSGPLGTTNYLYDGKNLLEEVDNAGNILARYTETRGLDEELSVLRSGTTSYFQTDGLGSATSFSNGAGALAKTYTFDGYGKQTASTGTLTNQFQYTGREFDSETGLYFNRARYYDPSVGRFISEDPVGFLGGINKYAYVLNRPINFSDPSGLDCPEFPMDCVHTPDERAQMQREHDQMMQQILGPDPSIPDGGPTKPPPPPQPSNCDRQRHHECVSAYVETATGGVVILADVAFAWYVIPELFAEGPLEGWEAISHGGPVVVPGVLIYWDGVMNITEHCPLFVDWFIGPGPSN